MRNYVRTSTLIIIICFALFRFVRLSKRKIALALKAFHLNDYRACERLTPHIAHTYKLCIHIGIIYVKRLHAARTHVCCGLQLRLSNNEFDSIP